MRAIAVLHLMGWVLSTLSATMLLPAAFAVALDSLATVQAFMVPAFIVGFLGGCLILACRGRSEFSSRWESLLLLGLVWAVVPLAAALPFYTAGFPGGLAASVFEATSGFTTSGGTAIADLAQTPRGIIVWRAMLQWTGGLTTLLALVAILGPLSGADLLDRQIYVIGRSTHGTVRHMMDAIRSVTPVYLALTMACFTALVLTGIPAFDAFCLSLSSVSTGGFMPREGTLAAYEAPVAELFLAFFMIVGAVSVLWLRAILQRRWAMVREAREPFWIIWLVAILAMVLFVLLVGDGYASSWRATFQTFTGSIATAASIVSTTGFAVSTPAQSIFPIVVLLGLVLLGAGRFSTAGGLKIFRVVSMLRQCVQELRNLVYPHGVQPARHGDEGRDAEIIRAIWITFTAYMLTASLLALFLAASGLQFSGALLASVGALGNNGPVYEFARAAHFPETPAYPAMSAPAHLILCFGMVAGRVEIIAFLTLLNVANWRN